MISKKKYLLLLTVVLLTVALLAGCGSNNNNGDNDDADPAKVDLVLNHFMAPVHPVHEHILVPWAEEVYERTEGRVEVFIHPSNALAAPGDSYDAMEQGIIDITFVLPAYTPGRFDISTILEFPFMFNSSMQANQAAKELMPILQETDYQNSKLLWFGGTDLGHLLMSDQVETVDGLRGLRMRSPGPIYNDVIEALGAVAVTMPVSDLYDALDRGIVDGTFMAPSGLISFRLVEIVDSVTQLELYATPLVMAMNQNSWNSISAQDQAIIEELLADFPEKMGAQYDEEIAKAMQVAEENNLTITRFSDEELEKFHQVVDPLIEGWIADMEAKGLPGQEAFDTVVEAAERYAQ